MTISEVPPPADQRPSLPASEGNVLRLAELNFTELEALDRDRTVVLFVVSPLEEHGPHLPVGTDIFTADFFCDELGRRIAKEKPGWTVLIGPSVPIGASVFDRAGTLRARARTVRNVARDYGAALARHGFRTILLVNGHGGPRHIVALEEAAAAVSRRYGVRMLSVSGPVLWQLMRGRYTDRVEKLLNRPLTSGERESFQGDTHAGLWETSLLLMIRPDLVKQVYTDLPPVRFTLFEALRRNYPLRLGNRMGYIGSPSAAKAEFGEVARRLLTEAAWDVVHPIFEPRGKNWRQTSVLYKIPFLHTGFPYVALGIGLMLVIWAMAQWLYG